MNPLNPNEGPDPLDAELRRRIVRVSPELDSRFRSLQAELQQERRDAQVRVHSFPLWLTAPLWAGAAAAAVVSVAWLWLASPPQTTSESPENFVQQRLLTEDPFTWDASLAEALVLLDDETLETLLNYPYESHL
jgi:hypothetical protein